MKQLYYPKIRIFQNRQVPGKFHLQIISIRTENDFFKSGQRDHILNQASQSQVLSNSNN